MPPIIDLTGQTFHRFTVLERDTDRLYPTRWICRCECGTVKSVTSQGLRAGQSKSCGCEDRKARVTKPEKVRKPRKNAHAFVESWRAIKSMCNREGGSYRKNGIRLCDRWQDFWRFLEDMGDRPPGHVLNRIDKTKGFEPSNCEWKLKQVG